MLPPLLLTLQMIRQAVGVVGRSPSLEAGPEAAAAADLALLLVAS
jgi:hypothetical protein